MGRKRDLQFCESAYMNNRTYLQYYNRLTELAISMFEWQNLPETVDQRFLEMCLFGDGMCVFFQDEVLGYLSLQCMIGGKLNVYRIPMERKAYATNGYQRELDGTNSVIIFNNYLHTNSMLDVEMFSKRLYNLDRAIDVNANAQKTPVLIQCDESQRLTMKNLYKQYEGNEPFIFGSKGLDANGLKVLQTGAPYVADKLYELKTQIWNEALTYLGISNINVVKKERMITDEVTRNQGGTVASRYSRLESRRQACKQINEMFGLNIWVDYREDFQDIEEQQNENEEEEKEYRGGEVNE
nr:MAG TPA: upper collar protein [Caudoviricetes sp.]